MDEYGFIVEAALGNPDIDIGVCVCVWRYVWVCDGVCVCEDMYECVMVCVCVKICMSMWWRVEFFEFVYTIPFFSNIYI